MSDEAAPETKGVTAKLLATVDLGPEIEGMAGALSSKIWQKIMIIDVLEDSALD